MHKFIYILFLISIISSQTSSNQEGWYKEIKKYLIKEEPETKILLQRVRGWLKDDELDKRDEIYLKVWEIKALFYEGEIDSSRIKFNEFKEELTNKTYPDILGDFKTSNAVEESIVSSISADLSALQITSKKVDIELFKKFADLK